MVSPDASPSPLKRSATKALVQVQSQTERFIDPRFHDAKKLTKGVDIPGTPVGFDRLVIRPGNRLVGVFDFIIAICVIYSAIVAPLKVAYQASFMNDIEIVFDVLFVMDMVLQCLYGYMEGGYPVLSLKLVTVRYARSWFLVDLIAVLPWETFAAEFSFLVLIKTVRLLRLRRMLSGLNMRSGSNFLRVVIIISVWLLITHWCPSAAAPLCCSPAACLPARTAPACTALRVGTHPRALSASRPQPSSRCPAGARAPFSRWAGASAAERMSRRG